MKCDCGKPNGFCICDPHAKGDWMTMPIGMSEANFLLTLQDVFNKTTLKDPDYDRIKHWLKNHELLETRGY